VKLQYEPDPFPPHRHEDGWQNPITGVGTWDRDKAQHVEFRTPEYSLTMDFARLSSMYHYDPLSRKIVDAWPKHMFRRGWDLEIVGEKKTSQTYAAIAKDVKRIALVPKMRKAASLGRNYGGSLMILGAKDGRPLDQPLDEANIRSVDYINVQDRRYIQVVAYYTDPKLPKLGEPAVYRVFSGPTTGMPSVGAPPVESAALFDVHESRVIRFDGAETDDVERLRLGGWSHSVLQAPYEEIKRFMQSFQNAGHLLNDASQGVYKLKGLMQQLASKQGRANLNARMAMMDMARSVARSLLLDADGEEFSRVVTSFTSVPELLDRFMQMLSMVTGIPVTILMGRSAAGMNATGDSDFRAFYDEVQSAQVDELEPKLLRAYHVLLLAKSGPTKGKDLDIGFNFRPLWVPTDVEKADANLKQAQADAIYLDREVFSPEECAINRFRDGRPNFTTTIDLDAREEAMEQGVSFDAHPNDPEETPEDGTDAANAGENDSAKS